MALADLQVVDDHLHDQRLDRIQRGHHQAQHQDEDQRKGQRPDEFEGAMETSAS
jgi:hypothetical protein